MEHLPLNIEKLAEPEPLSTQTIAALARQYRDITKYLIIGGKLKQGRWRVVLRHSFTVLAACDALADLIALPEEQKVQLCTAAGIHDADKRVERDPQSFSQEERERFQYFHNQFSHAHGLVRATSPWFIDVVHDKDFSFLHKLLVYADCVCMHDAIVRAGVRLDEVQARIPLQYPDLIHRFPNRYFDRVREWTGDMEEELHPLLPKEYRGIHAQDIPLLTKHVIQEKAVGGGQE